jgi:phytoene desaturase
MTKKVAIIGSGFSSLSAATTLASYGFETSIIEKNGIAGGRAQKLEEDGFIFDMGPSWYWMPDVFEKYFNRFDKSVSDYYQLVRLDPSYKVVFQGGESLIVPANINEYRDLLESLEKGSGNPLTGLLNRLPTSIRSE